MGIAGVAIAAPELAPPVRIQSPRERHAGPDAIQDTARLQLEIADDALGFQNFALGRQSGDPDQARRGRIPEQHNPMFAFYSPLVKRPLPALLTRRAACSAGGR